jgi:hypothetical protein
VQSVRCSIPAGHAVRLGLLEARRLAICTRAHSPTSASADTCGWRTHQTVTSRTIILCHTKQSLPPPPQSTHDVSTHLPASNLPSTAYASGHSARAAAACCASPGSVWLLRWHSTWRHTGTPQNTACTSAHARRSEEHCWCSTIVGASMTATEQSSNTTPQWLWTQSGIC